MARTPHLQLTDISLNFGGDPLFSDLGLVVQPGDRVALVGRNGSGKSTLMKVMGGLIEPDTGQRFLAPGVTTGYMHQEPDLTGFDTLGEFALSDMDPSEEYKLLSAAEGLKLNLEAKVDAASGGERRRAALAKLLAEAPELMLLDEPTNHLDIEAIAWLEGHLSSTRAAYILISHDRAFLRALTRATLWVDRGQVRRQEQGFDRFEEWRDKMWEEEDQQRHKLNRKIKAEARWAVEGISARRKRNQGRVRALQDLRAEKASQIKRQGAAAMALDAGPKSGKQVFVMDDVSLAFGDKTIVKNFSLKVNRGDRIALVGPNGAGKTTLLKLMTAEVAPDSGTVKIGTNLEMAVFDQNRAALNPEDTLWSAMTEDPATRVRGQGDHVMVRGNPKHVVGYLKEFLFDEGQARAPVKSLSGGEKARLLLARIMARSSNLLILDEPTNDLDIETLDLMQELISDYDGTVILVSHDRDFLDRVASTTVALKDGNATVYAGGWSDYKTQAAEAGDATVLSEKPVKSRREKGREAAEEKNTDGGLSFTEKHRLEALPAEMERLEAEIAKLVEFLSDPNLFTDHPAKFQKATDALVERQAVLDAAEEEWMHLEEKAG
ncbi:ATP-binding cassette domain-containing protein [uncultured Litoreibacter sp.]|uniref:ABC-F family ATP-binding cassette domain-containing protein n=1 Tax=uncultured Litoreibacter sp. TaxID=1392394 RepID=UPI002639CA42|nr:ATP-binding cassette domain-containing protein [uncultured Litoreibacter sp.]